MNHLEFVLHLLVSGAVFSTDYQPDHSVVITSGETTVRISQTAFQALKEAVRQQGALDRRNEIYQSAMGWPVVEIAA